MNDEIQALVNGGRQGLAGAAPSAANPPGSPPAQYPLDQEFQQVLGLLNSLSAKLARQPQGGRQASQSVSEIAVKLQRVYLTEEKKYQQASEAAATLGGDAVGRANGINAMGVPR